MRPAVLICFFTHVCGGPKTLAPAVKPQGLAFAMLKRTGKGGMAPFKGTGFFTGRTVNARRETEWSAPSYFDMCVYGLGPPFRGEPSETAASCGTLSPRRVSEQQLTVAVMIPLTVLLLYAQRA